MIAIHQRIIPHYRVAIFDEIINRFSDVLIFYGQQHKNGSIGNAELQNRRRYIRVKNLYPSRSENIFISSITWQLLREKPQIIVAQSNLGNLNLWIFILLKKFIHSKLILWGHGWNRVVGFHPENSVPDKLALFIMRMADAVLLYSNSARSELGRFLEPSKIFVAPNTIDTRLLSEIYRGLEAEGRESVKKRNGFDNQFNLIFIGRLTNRKEPFRLIEVFRIVRDRLNDVALHIVGEGELLGGLKEFVQRENIKGIKFYGSIYDAVKTGEMLFASDLFVMPGILGLSINHAFCFGCPVISQAQSPEGPFHSPEIEYLENGVTGFLVSRGDNDKMAATILNYLHDEVLQKRMRVSTLEVIRTRASLEQMLLGFENAIRFVEGK